MKKLSEKTAIRALVNLKCLGKLGRCARGFSYRERGQVFDIWEAHGWVVPGTLDLTPAGDEIVLQNLSLCE